MHRQRVPLVVEDRAAADGDVEGNVDLIHLVQNRLNQEPATTTEETRPSRSTAPARRGGQCPVPATATELLGLKIGELLNGLRLGVLHDWLDGWLDGWMHGWMHDSLHESRR